MICQLLSYLLGDKDVSHLGDNHLLCVAGEYCRGKLVAKEKAAFSFKYLLVYSFRVKSVEDALYPSGRSTSFSMQPANFG